MPHPLYSVLAFTCLIVLLIFRNQFKIVLDEREQSDKDFLFLSNWVTFFCLQDGLWGFIGSGAVHNNSLFFISSTVFYVAAAISAYVWLSYILNFINMERNKAIVAKVLSIILVIFQLVLLWMNFSTKSIFDIDADGLYKINEGRDLLFYSQYATFFISGLFTTIRIRSATSTSDKRRYFTGFLFIFAPILFGIFQQIFPFAPCNTIGYMLGCCTIYAFFISQISRNRDESQKAVIIAGLSSDYDLVLYMDIAKNQVKYTTGATTRRSPTASWAGSSGRSPPTLTACATSTVPRSCWRRGYTASSCCGARTRRPPPTDATTATAWRRDSRLASTGARRASPR